jgi:hypothetical protein
MGTGGGCMVTIMSSARDSGGGDVDASWRGTGRNLGGAGEKAG